MLGEEVGVSWLPATLGLAPGLTADSLLQRVGARGGKQPKKPDSCLLRDATMILVDCALRPEECFRLRPENVRDGAIYVYRGKRVGSRRRIRLTDAVMPFDLYTLRHT